MTLRLELTAAATPPIDLGGVLPTALNGRSAAEIARIEVPCGNRRTPLGELFRVDGSIDDGQIELAGDLCRVDRIAAGMDGGGVRVFGRVGRRAGAAMIAGRLEIEGDAGDWLGAEMRGGAIRLAGSAGHGLGGAEVGSTRGMTGGEILVERNAGDEVGRAMRRGLIAVAGNAGRRTGEAMLAGTILVCGTAGPFPGNGMRRGTIGILGGTRPELLPTFRPGCVYRPPMWPLLTARLRNLGFSAAELPLLVLLELFHGDLLEGGRGEIFFPAA